MKVQLLVGVEPALTRDEADISVGVVLARRCPERDQLPDRVGAVAVVMEDDIARAGADASDGIGELLGRAVGDLGPVYDALPVVG